MPVFLPTMPSNLVVLAAIISVAIDLSMGEDRTQIIQPVAVTIPSAPLASIGRKCPIGMCLHPAIRPHGMRCVFHACGPDGRGSCCAHLLQSAPVHATMPVDSLPPSAVLPVKTDIAGTTTPLPHIVDEQTLPKTEAVIGGRVVRAIASMESSVGGYASAASTDNDEAESINKIKDGGYQTSNDHKYESLPLNSYSSYGAPRYDDPYSYRSAPVYDQQTMSCSCTPINDYGRFYRYESGGYDHTIPSYGYNTPNYNNYVPTRYTYPHVVS